MKNSADLGGCYPPRPSASVDNILLDLQNSSYPIQPHSVIAKYIQFSILIYVIFLSFVQFNIHICGIYLSTFNLICQQIVFRDYSDFEYIWSLIQIYFVG